MLSFIVCYIMGVEHNIVVIHGLKVWKLRLTGVSHQVGKREKSKATFG